MKWISVKDALPTKGGTYFVFFKDGARTALTFFPGTQRDLAYWDMHVSKWLDESEEKTKDPNPMPEINVGDLVVQDFDESFMGVVAKINPTNVQTVGPVYCSLGSIPFPDIKQIWRFNMAQDYLAKEGENQ